MLRLVLTIPIMICMVLCCLLIDFCSFERDIASIKPGMTRAEVENLFPIDGGLQSPQIVRFSRSNASYLHFDVEFPARRIAMAAA